MQKKLYQITEKVNSRKIAEFLSKERQTEAETIGQVAAAGLSICRLQFA